MVEINVSQYDDWDAMIEYTKEMQQTGMQVKLTNICTLFEIWFSEELEQMGFKSVMVA